MVEKIYERPEVYRIPIPLPDNPLKTLNSYVIKTPEENLIIDTGFHRPECSRALFAGLEELSIAMKKTSVFVTHLHSDHVGLVPEVLDAGAGQVYMGSVDYHYLKQDWENDRWGKMEDRFVKEGFPQETMVRLRTTNQARAYAPARLFPAVELSDGEKLQIGNLQFCCIHTPGHTPGQMCLYLPEEKLLFSGDHVLFDITPNITPWIGVEDSLKDYLDSLKKIQRLYVKKTFPGHRKEYGTLGTRVEELLLHHKMRLASVLQIVDEKEEACAYEIASALKWNMRGLPWETFPDNQKWFALGETLSHLDYLILRGELCRFKKNGRLYYRMKEKCQRQ